MKRLNRRGYMTIEIILASVFTVVIAFFLIEITMDIVSTTDDAYADTVLVSDKALITNNIKQNLKNDICTYGEISSVSCSNNTCNITMGSTNVVLKVGNNKLEYNGNENYSKTIHNSLTNITLTSYNDNDYYNFKISGTNIFADNNYDMNIFIYNEC